MGMETKNQEKEWKRQITTKWDTRNKILNFTTFPTFFFLVFTFFISFPFFLPTNPSFPSLFFLDSPLSPSLSYISIYPSSIFYSILLLSIHLLSIFYFAVLWIVLRASHMMSKWSTAKLYRHSVHLILILDRALSSWPGWTYYVAQTGFQACDTPKSASWVATP